MKEITPEIKQRIFGIYYGCGEIVMRGSKGIIHLNVSPLSQITDEYAKEISWITSEWDTGSTLDPEDVSEWLDEIMTGNCATTADYVSGYQMMEIIDFLRSKGYALPAFGYSVEELVNAGIFKLKK